MLAPFGRVRHLFALGDGLLLLVADGVLPISTGYEIVVLNVGVLVVLELEEAGEDPLPPDTSSDAFAQNAMRRFTWPRID